MAEKNSEPETDARRGIEVSYPPPPSKMYPPPPSNKVVGEKDEPVEQPVVNRQKYALSFENLTVYVPGTTKNCCHSMGNPFGKFMQEYLGMQTEEKDPFYSLDAVSGYLKSGELCLVLGSNDQSKSTLLRALSGRLNKKDEVSGSVLLNGIPMANSHHGWRKLCSYVSTSDATHSAVLTVRETFEFAAKCTSDGMQTDEQIDERVDRLMKNLGLNHVADTVVGDENLRGISGGQKRRVTVGEMMIDASCSFMCLENITDGLSSTDSSQLIQSFRDACHDSGHAAFISLLQPSDKMVELFDKILVLSSHGELTYFGPAERNVLRQIFLGNKANDPNEDNGSICDLVLQHSLGDSSGDDEAALILRNAKSENAKAILGELAELRSNAPPARDRDINTILPDKEYPNSGWYQFKILAGRRVKLINRNAVTWTRMAIAVVFGIIIGSLFSALKNNLLGALGFTGYIFLNCFLVLMLSAAVTIPSAYRERVTLFKHRSAEFYSGKVAYLAQVITDAPLSIWEAVLLSCISYFWVGMSSKPGDFFYFMGILIGLESAGQALGRLLCALCRKQVTANAMSSVVILLFGTVGGFMPSYGAIHPILRWLSWLTPVSYAFEGLMINEFFQRNMEPLLVTGMGTTEEVGFNGNTWMANYDLPRIEFANPDAIRIFNLFMVFMFALVYDILGFHFIEKTRGWYHYQTRRPQSRVIKSFTMAAPLTTTADEEKAASSYQTGSALDRNWPHSLSVQDLVYEVPRKNASNFNLRSLVRRGIVRLAGKKAHPPFAHASLRSGNNLRLLNGVNARFCRGRMVALMGTSGAGKTTLMDVIAGYKTGGQVTGDIFIDGQPKDPAIWKKISGYAEQNDILNPYLSVIETLRFTANCRLPRTHNKSEVITRILTLMNLVDWKDYVVGREIEGEGLPKHARKRLTIAIQLVILPKILFLDEPTTGLGNNAAALVIRAVRSATDALSLITLATIHQPSKLIWDSFDDTLLLARGGRVTYMGESGPQSKVVLEHFATISGEAPPERCNPADFCLGVLNKMDASDSEAVFQKSRRYAELISEISDDVQGGKGAKPAIELMSPNNVFNEFLLLTVRHLIVQWRNPSYCLMRIVTSTIMSFYIGLLFVGDKSTLDGAVFSIGAIFFLVFVLVIPMQAAVVPLVEDRAVLYRETVSGTYSRISYGLGQVVADQPFHLLNTGLMFVSFYFLVGFRLTGEEVGYFIIMLYLANWIIQSLGQLFALATPNEESANGLGGLSVILSVILMGFLLTVSTMPDGWVWAYWANLFHYILQGLVTNELAGNSYFIDLRSMLPDIGPNATSILAFGGGVDPLSTQSRQLSSIMALAINSPDGINPEPRDLSSLINCTISNGCFADTETEIAKAFTQCYIINGIRGPPCGDEFSGVIENINITEISSCFSFEESQNTPNDELPSFIPKGYTEEEFDEMDDRSKLETVLCLMKALLPPDKVEAIGRLIAVIEKLFGVLVFFLEILENGIYLPGELILFFFGWAEYEEGEGIIAPFKWWYCMTSVAIFLGAIEVFKLLAIRFIVWTKR